MLFVPIDSLYQRVVLSRRSSWEVFRAKHPKVFKSLYGVYRLYKGQRWLESHRIYSRLKDFTLLTRRNYVINLALCDQFRHIQGAVVECGTWKGGMIAGIASLFNDDRDYLLYDSFDGFPPAEDIDIEAGSGRPAKDWQAHQHLPGSKNNCRADISFARQAMALSGAKHVSLNKGWFNETLPKYPGKPIAILRLDADWYQSTMDALTYLYPHVVKGGVIIIDDYYYWQGCALAVHDFLSANKLAELICQFRESYAYMIKR